MRNVLVVEDDVHQQKILTKALESYGVHVTTADSVHGATEAFDSAAPGHFLAVILDDMIIGGSGVEVLEHIRSKDTVIPVLFLSARSDVVSSRLYAGADNYLVKPQDPATIAAYIEAAISRMSAHMASRNSSRADQG